MNKRSIIVGVAIALTAIVALAAVQYFVGRGLSSSFAASCGYEDCNWHGGKITIREGGTYPPTCPTCERPSVLPLATCRKCGHQQIVNELLIEWLDREGLSQQTECAKCGGRIVHGD